MNPSATHQKLDRSRPWAVAATLPLAVPLLLGACKSQPKDRSPCDAHPPAHIDIDVCARLVDDRTSARNIECDTCCQNAGFSDYSYACNQHCTCGDSPSVSDTVTCAMETASSDICSSCCLNAGYHQSTWSAAACSCLGLQDNDQICAATLDQPDPGQACPNCCLDNGYLNVNYFALTRQCTCSG